MNILYSFDLFGTFIFAATGAIAAGSKKMDLFGVIFIGFITAVGGGTIRDLLLGFKPVFWVQNLNYIIIALFAGIIVFLFSKQVLKIKNILIIGDAIGLGVFTIIGIKKSFIADVSPIISIIMGITTAVIGGIIRDIICNQIPLILNREIYATACLAGGILFFILRYFNFNEDINICVCSISIFLIRMISLKFKLSLPRLTA